ncbi:MAG: hypothetical protein ACYDG6_06730 [Thermincolia bacterium]
MSEKILINVTCAPSYLNKTYDLKAGREHEVPDEVPKELADNLVNSGWAKHIVGTIGPSENKAVIPEDNKEDDEAMEKPQKKVKKE